MGSLKIRRAGSTDKTDLKVRAPLHLDYSWIVGREVPCYYSIDNFDNKFGNSSVQEYLLNEKKCLQKFYKRK